MTHADRLREMAETTLYHDARSEMDLAEDAAACLSGARAIERLQEIEKEQKIRGRDSHRSALPNDTEPE